MISNAARIQFKLAIHPRPIQFGNIASTNIERTFVAIKPDGMERQLLPDVLTRLYNKGLHLVGMKMMQFPQKAVDGFYGHHADKPFYKPLTQGYMQRGPIVAMVWEGPNAVKAAMDVIGPTNPQDAKAGTVRGDYAWYKKDNRPETVQENVAHRSDNPAEVAKEIGYFFQENEIMPIAKPPQNQWFA